MKSSGGAHGAGAEAAGWGVRPRGARELGRDGRRRGGGRGKMLPRGGRAGGGVRNGKGGGQAAKARRRLGGVGSILSIYWGGRGWPGPASSSSS